MYTYEYLHGTCLSRKTCGRSITQLSKLTIVDLLVELVADAL